MTTPARPVVVSLIWMIFGAVALVAVTVGITVSVASVHTADRTAELVRQLHRANGQIGDLRTESAATQAAAAAQSQQAAAERTQLRRQYRLTQAQLLAVLTYLREHGIDIPPAVVKPSADTTARPRPKATGPRGPNPSTAPQQSPHPSPRPTGGTTTGPTTAPAITDLTCLLGPLLCP